MKISFLGATETVTGSKYLLEYNNVRILIDCGLFQGRKDLRLLNWDKLEVDPRTINYVVLTHAHIDHSGYLPLLVKNGFRGKIFSSHGTMQLCDLLLRDSGHIQEEDAKRANKYSYSKHHPALPLYTAEDAQEVMKYFYAVDYAINIKINDDISFNLARSGHIIGSSFVTINYDNKKLVFSGDIGRSNDPLMQRPSQIQQADYLVLESTYGNRLHDNTNPEIVIKRIVNETIAKGGTILIPAFAVGRATSILYHLYNLKKNKEIPDIPIFMDSPMAVSAANIFCLYNKDHRLPKNLCEAVFSIAKYTRSIEDSKAIDDINLPKIIVSASGMATGGRILHHLKRFVENEKNTILFTGFQAEGTRGSRILSGEKEIKIHGKLYQVKALVESIPNMSAHADYKEIIEWLSHFNKPPIKIFITHGEKTAAEALKEKIIQTFNWNVVVAKYKMSEKI